MCMQCMATAITAGAAAGTRVALAARLRAFCGEAGLRRATAALLGLAVLVSGLAIGGSGA